MRPMTLAEYLAQPGHTSVALAAALGVSHTSVLRWAGSRVPAERVAAVAAATGLRKCDLRPDLHDCLEQAA
jgi:DNA-binding transcriptional regulator YdaS (Cro superfamily)